MWRNWWPVEERPSSSRAGFAQGAGAVTDQPVVGDFRSLRAGLRENGRTDAESVSSSTRVPQDSPPTSRTLPYDLLHLGPGDLVARVGPCLIIVTHSLTLEGVDAIGRGLAKQTQRQQKACSISIVERKSGPGTTPEARAAIAELVRKYDTSISGAAVVCDGSGFLATAVRSVVTAINMASRASHPSKVFATCEPALDWLQTTRPAHDLDIALLGQAVATLRPRLKDHMQRLAAAPPRP
jgi:hypothetical protein